MNIKELAELLGLNIKKTKEAVIQVLGELYPSYSEEQVEKVKLFVNTGKLVLPGQNKPVSLNEQVPEQLEEILDTEVYLARVAQTCVNQHKQLKTVLAATRGANKKALQEHFYGMLEDVNTVNKEVNAERLFLDELKKLAVNQVQN